MTEATATEATAATAGSEGGTGAEDISGLKSALEKERDARKTAEKGLTKLQARIDALEAKDKTDVERITGERDKFKSDLDASGTRLREMAVTTALTNALSQAGARHPALMVSDLAGKAEVDDDLKVTNADKLVADAKKAYPDLFRVVEGKSDAGEGRDDGAGTTTNMNRLIRRQAGYAA